MQMHIKRSLHLLQNEDKFGNTTRNQRFFHMLFIMFRDRVFIGKKNIKSYSNNITISSQCIFYKFVSFMNLIIRFYGSSQIVSKSYVSFIDLVCDDKIFFVRVTL